MLTIREVLNLITSEQRKQLMIAFENKLTQHVEYTPGKYVGVYAQHNKQLTPTQIVGDWSTGTIKW